MQETASFGCPPAPAPSGRQAPCYPQCRQGWGLRNRRRAGQCPVWSKRTRQERPPCVSKAARSEWKQQSRALGELARQARNKLSRDVRMEEQTHGGGGLGRLMRAGSQLGWRLEAKRVKGPLTIQCGAFDRRILSALCVTSSALRSLFLIVLYPAVPSQPHRDTLSQAWLLGSGPRWRASPLGRSILPGKQ